MLQTSRLHSELQTIKAYLEQTLQSPHPDLENLFLNLQSSQGKMLRAQFCLIFAHLFQENLNDDQIQVAASIELIHLATLIHDDIIDCSPIRRNQPSVQSAFGADVAVYAGDYIFTKYFALIQKLLAHNSTLIQANIDVMSKILEGELRQKESRFNLQHSLETELQIIQTKTAALFALAAFEGATLAGATEKQAHICAEIGLKIGTIFQLLDDLLDLTSTVEQSGKSVQTDFQNGIYTYPLLCVWHQDKEFFANYLSSNMNHANLLIVIEKVKQLGGIERTKNYIHQLGQELLDLCALLPNNNWQQLLVKNCQKLIKKA